MDLGIALLFKNEAEVFKDALDTFQLPTEVAQGRGKYVFRFWGAAMHLPGFSEKYGEPNEKPDSHVYARWFNTQAELTAFRKELNDFIGPDAAMVRGEPRENGSPFVTYRVIGVATLRYEGKDYEVRADYGYGYPPRTVIFDWQENNTSCDCRRVPMLARQHPGVVSQAKLDATRKGCFETVPVVAFRIELAE